MVCPECGSDNLVTTMMIWDRKGEEIPAGTKGRIGCRDCFYWQEMLALKPAKDIFDSDPWVILVKGKGNYSNSEEKEKMITYRDPDADWYPRHS